MRRLVRSLCYFLRIFDGVEHFVCSDSNAALKL